MSEIKMSKFTMTWRCLLLTLTHVVLIFPDSQSVPQYFQQGYFQHSQPQPYETVGVSSKSDLGSTAPPVAVTRTRHSQITLSPTVRTQHVFAMLTNDTTFGFDLPIGQRVRDVSTDYKINLVIETLDWDKYYRRVDTKPPCVLIQGLTAENVKKSVKFCREVHNDLNNFQMVGQAVDDLSVVTVSAEGDWTDTQAKLVASVYYEVSGGCKNCAGGYFCCGTEGSSCSTGRRNGVNDDEGLFRCIPVSSHNGDRNSDTVCNSHPNCAFVCNLDESPEECSKGSNAAAAPMYFSSHRSLGNSAVLKIIIFVIFSYLRPLMT